MIAGSEYQMSASHSRWKSVAHISILIAIIMIFQSFPICRTLFFFDGDRYDRPTTSIINSQDVQQACNHGIELGQFKIEI